ncbi:MAG TPA: MFS transporter [Acetobacteraceae bacterium]|nr:MFS transporter [Acetobacteraceae bacterium]
MPDSGETGRADPLDRAPPRPRRWRRPDRALLLMAAYGFVSGLPLPLSGFTLRQWLSEGGVSLAAIGLTANIGLSYSLKFLWAPLLDQVRPPLFLARFGRRRGWLLAVQPALAAACALLALSDPARAPIPCIAAAALVAFLSATQDIGIDAWRIETFPQRLQGAAMAAYVWGYRIALLVSVGGAIALATPLGWHGSLLLMAALVALGVPVTLLAREPAGRPPARVGAGFLARMRGAVVAPLRDFATRPRAGETLAFVMLFKLGEAMAGTMAAPFYRAMGFNRAQVALATSVPNLAASLAGAAFGGWLVIRLGAGRALVLTGFVQMASMGMYFALAVSHGDPHILYAKVVVEAFAEAMADAAFITFLSGLCSPEFTATQYALLSSLAALALRTIGGLSGFLAEALGWVPFYGLTIFTALPAMLIMLDLLRRERLARA